MTTALPLALALAAVAPAHTLDVTTLPRPSGTEWFGLYLLGKKAGYSHSWVGIEKREGRRVLVARSKTVLSATVGTRVVERSQADEKVYEARPGGKLLAFSSRREGDGGNRTVEGTCTAEGCTALLVAEGQREERKLPPVHDTAEQADGARLAALTGTTVKGEQLDLEALRVKQVEDRFVGRERVAAAGVSAEVTVVEEKEEGDRAPSRVAVARDGRIVELRLGDAVVARAEPEETAKRLDRVDLFALTRVKLALPLPRAVPGSIRYRIRGLPKEFQAADPRQTWSDAGDGTVALTVVARQPMAADPKKDPPRLRGSGSASSDELLRSTPDVDADHPRIRALAREIVGSEPGVYGAAVKIEQDVYRRLEKAYGVSRDRASEVLALGKGDCTEHALLFTALARAAGIPTRQVHGLVFASYEDAVPAMYWHAWVEVKAGDEWIALDPTFGQAVADPTHIALGRGTQVDTVGLLGAIEVLSADAAPLPHGDQANAARGG
jgi:transglutaminase-like putative cysteine protease